MFSQQNIHLIFKLYVIFCDCRLNDQRRRNKNKRFNNVFFLIAKRDKKGQVATMYNVMNDLLRNKSRDESEANKPDEEAKDS